MDDPLESWLVRMQAGDPEALSRVVRLLYDELRSIAHRRLASERDHHTLGTTALVNEAFLRLVRNRELPAESRTTFLAAASNTMRRVLVDYARARKRIKRGAGAHAVPLEDADVLLGEEAADEVLALEDALQRLTQAEPRAARVVELRYFAGLTLEEIARHLELSEKTVRRDWILARAWLRREVSGDAAHEA